MRLFIDLLSASDRVVLHRSYTVPLPITPQYAQRLRDITGQITQDIDEQLQAWDRQAQWTDNL
ncbi:hypothetical protein H6771_02445 [Candidatus Peribacteria bacterium]|nr:hypothetical protein [Candidatus Peribacteria bacterium]